MPSETNNNIQVLCTRDVPQELLEQATLKGIDVECISFIQTEAIKTIVVQQEIENALLLSTSIVFTSMNAVEAVAEFLYEAQPDWQIYCIGNTTRKLVAKYFGEHSIAATAANATELAEKIIETEAVEELIFFCGNQRRNELPDLLKAQNIAVDEIVVYNTFDIPHHVEKKYNGILFFSPSAVESFFSANKLGTNIVFFAIGDTTAAAIKKYTQNPVIIADEPGKEALLQQAIDFFSQTKIL